MSKLNDLLEDVLGMPVAKMNESIPFAEFADWNSLKHVHLIVGIQGAFEVELDREEIQGLKTVSDIRGLLAERGACQ